MTKEEAIQLGIAAEKARHQFHILGQENTQSGKDREKQVLRYETARAEMHEATNRHHEALQSLGINKSKTAGVEVYLREVDANTDNACWVICSKGDPGAHLAIIVD